MSHFTKEQWRAFMEGSLQEQEQRQMEEHLYRCHDCLADYTDALTFPDAAPVCAQFTDNVLAQLEFKPPVVAEKRKRGNVLRYYVLAASVALVLSATGIFTSLTKVYDRVPVVTTTIEKWMIKENSHDKK